MTQDKVRWGVLGTARIAHDSVIPAIMQSANGKVVAIAGRNEERVNMFAEKFGIPNRYKNYEQLLASPDVDAVYIPLPNSMHREWAIKSAEKRKHVLCEKPLALSSVHCREMISACNASGVLLMEAFMYRFHPQINRIRSEIEAGTVGRVNEVRSSFWFRLDDLQDIRYQKELGGGALMDIGCYCVNVSRLILGSEPMSFQAMCRVSEKKDVDEITLGLMRFPDSRFAYFDCGFLGPLYNPLQVIGTEGILELPEAFEFPQHPRLLVFKDDPATPASVIELEASNPYRLMVEHFGDCLLHHHDPKFPASDAENNLRAIEQLLESGFAKNDVAGK